MTEPTADARPAIRGRPPVRPTSPRSSVRCSTTGRNDDTFRASIDGRADAPEYVFYDGPPFANGLPHYGHLLTGYVKDIVPRYQTMRGHKVERRFGWDCHGLPAELEAETAARHHRTRPRSSRWASRPSTTPAGTRCCKYTNEWRAYVTRQARWVDFDNDYKTLDLVVHGERHVGVQAAVGQGPGSTRASGCCRTAGTIETPLSNHETADGRRRLPEPQDPAVTVGFRLRAPGSELDGARSADLDHDAVDAAVQPGGRGQPRRGATCVVAGDDGRAVRAGARRDWPPTPANWARTPQILGSYTGDRAAGPGATCRRSPTSPDAAERVSGPARRTSSPPRTAPAWCTWHPPTARTTSGHRHRRNHPGDSGGRQGPIHRRRCRDYAGPCRSSRPTRRSSAT